jgi:hypothetical protein
MIDPKGQAVAGNPKFDDDNDNAKIDNEEDEDVYRCIDNEYDNDNDDLILEND